MYKPNFCCDCGNQIVREHWRAWTSRKFCETCARRFRKQRIVVPALVCVSLFGSALTAERMIHTFRNASSPTLIVERNMSQRQIPPNLSPHEDASLKKSNGVSVGDNSNALTSTASVPELKHGKDGTATERPTDPNDAIKTHSIRLHRRRYHSNDARRISCL